MDGKLGEECRNHGSHGLRGCREAVSATPEKQEAHRHADGHVGPVQDVVVRRPHARPQVTTHTEDF